MFSFLGLDYESMLIRKDLFLGRGSCPDNETKLAVDAIIRGRNYYTYLGGKEHIREYHSVKGKILKFGRSDEFLYTMEQHPGRVGMSARFRESIEKRKLTHLQAPMTRLYKVGAEEYVVVADKIEGLRSRNLHGSYSPLGRDQVRELLLLMDDTEALDSSPENYPLTRDGRVALVDAEPLGNEVLRRVLGKFTYLPMVSSLFKVPQGYLTRSSFKEKNVAAEDADIVDAAQRRFALVSLAKAVATFALASFALTSLTSCGAPALVLFAVKNFFGMYQGLSGCVSLVSIAVLCKPRSVDELSRALAAP
jgi:hypothetical protein